MANGKRGEVSLEIGGETRLLRFTFSALKDLEAMHGGTPVQILFTQKAGVGVIMDALFCGLRHADPKLTPQQVGRWMDDEPRRLTEWAAALTEALTSALDIPKDDEVARPLTLVPPPTAPASETPTGSIGTT